VAEIVLKVDKIAKQYRLGVLGTGTLSHDLNRWWHLARGKEDPYLMVGDINNRATTGESEYVWALKNISFEVEKGEVLGIVGKNGAGKSTLLKILSKVTTPSEGEIYMKGRVASLLEVGTGFHPEQTGKENIYLNGAILGMTKKEIDAKIDEIVEFSGCERYVDTPVKRYSSGMKVRLAFAVAACLEPEILIVDEVLAVGDAEFQKKAISKMKDVSKGGGRTVLFVSHNMSAVKSLCTKAVLLENGEIADYGDTDAVISNYLTGAENIANHRVLNISKEGFTIKELGVRAKGKELTDPILEDEMVEVYFTYDNQSTESIHFTLNFKGEDGQVFMTTSSQHQPDLVKKGAHTSVVHFPANFFNEGTFNIDLKVVHGGKMPIIIEDDALVFLMNPEEKPIGSWMGKKKGYIKGKFDWT
jgi:lipopolysaccharide transport system ATP-binding protein